MMVKQSPSGGPRLVAVLLIVSLSMLQAPALAGQALENRVQELTRQVEQLSAMILELRAEISQSRDETRELRLEMQRISGVPAVAPQQSDTVIAGAPTAEERLEELEETQRLLADRLEEQYQTKVESASRYRTKLSGVVLLNAFANRGQVDREEVPNLAQRRGSAETGGSLGFTALQSQLGFETYGPTLAGARASAGLQFDFFGVSPGSGPYEASWGAVRLRTATMRLDWERTSVIVGQDAPFLSPLSPTSVASLGYPAFSFSGNLWTWNPQVRVERRFAVSERGNLSLQGGFFDPVPRASQQPGYATRFAWTYGDPDRPLTIGVGGYYSRQDYGAGRIQDGWAGTADWLIPLGSRFGLSGEFYRGRAFGSLGAAQGRSVLFDGPQSDPDSSITGLNSMGGWAQLTFKATSAIEFNAARGEDHPDSRDLQRFIPEGTYSASISRNRSELFNVVYRPRTDLVFSLEYRRMKTWRLSTGADKAKHLNLGIGVLF